MLRRDLEDEYELPMTEECPWCEGPGEFMGTLGGHECYRCRDCGAVFQTQKQEHTK